MLILFIVNITYRDNKTYQNYRKKIISAVQITRKINLII